jgi:citrate/tricarballylate utilization protein
LAPCSVNSREEWRRRMPELDIFQEANRQLVICNACRYCEGFCPVFQAIEIRRDFTKGDVFYLANLCHDCRACHYACMYSPPHEFAINIPQALSEARTESYKQWSWPAVLARSYTDRRFAVSLGIGVVSLIIALALWLIPPARLFGVSRGPGAFYEVVPYLAMVIPAIALLVYWLLIWLRGGLQFWSETDGTMGSRVSFKEIAKATGAMLGLRYLKGGGPGCSYPDQKPSMIRRVYHSFVFWGFLCDLIATTLAFVYQDLLHRLPPYPLPSAPVIFGSIGGVALMIGTIGLMWLKAESDSDLAGRDAYGMDYIFLGILFLTAFTGMLTLIFRTTAILGTILILHLALVASLFVTAPYGKFVHALYRSLALIKFQVEHDRH